MHCAVTFSFTNRHPNREKMKNVSFRNDVLPLKDMLYRLALRITQNREEAEDIVQDTLIKVWNRRDTWETIDSIEAFCTTICRNLSLDYLRRSDNQNEALDEKAHGTPDRKSSPYEQAVSHDRIDTVRRLIDSLPEKQRTAMQLRDFEGKSYKDIANVMGISEEQVKVNIFRARQAIKQKFSKIENYGL